MGRIMLGMLENWATENNSLTEAQYGFRRGIGMVEQCVNLELLIEKYTLAKERVLHLCFVDLTSALDLVNHAKLWQTLKGLGAPIDIITYLSQIYIFLTSRVRFGAMGECTLDFRVMRGI